MEHSQQGNYRSVGKVQLPVKERSCTDTFCCIALLIFTLIFLVIAGIAFYSGDPRKLIYPTDLHGHVCGIKTENYDFSDKPFLFLFDMALCFHKTNVSESKCQTPQLCVKKCPESYFAFGPSSRYTNPEAFNQLVSDIICVSDSVKNSLKTYNDVSRAVQDEQCTLYYFSSKSMARRCVPDVLINGWNETTEHIVKGLVTEPKRDLYEEYHAPGAFSFASLLKGSGRFLDQVCADLKSSWCQILIGLLASAALALLWIFLMQYCAVAFVWASIIGLIALFYGIAAFCWYMFVRSSSQNVAKEGIKNTEGSFVYLIAALIFSICAIVYSCVICCFFKRIGTAIVLIKEASKAISCMMSSLFFPILPTLMHVIILVFMGGVFISLASSGEPICRYTNDTPIGYTDISGNVVTNGTVCSCFNSSKTGDLPDRYCQFDRYSFSGLAAAAAVFCFFALLWFGFFVDGFNEMVLGGAFASWYWSFRKPEDVPAFAVIASLCRSVKYHLGTVALGSFLLATIRFIRYLLDIMRESARKSSDGVAAVIAQILLCIVNQCCACLEDLLRFLNKNAYILVSVHGTSFCTSAKNAFHLLTRNLVRVVVINQVTSMLLFFGQLVIVFIVAILAYLYYRTGLYDSLNYPILPIIVILIGSLIICSVFFQVYDAAIDTIFLCFLEDLENNDNTPEKSYYMSEELKLALYKEEAVRIA